MVHGLIEYHKLQTEVIDLKGYRDDFSTLAGMKVSMENWNPLHLAVAYGRTDIVRYLIEDQKVSLRLFGEKPLSDDENTTAET